MEKPTTRQPAPSKYTMFWDSRQKRWVYETNPAQVPTKWIDPRELEQQRQSRPDTRISNGLTTPPLSSSSRSASQPRQSTPRSVSPNPNPAKKVVPVNTLTPPATPPAQSAELSSEKKTSTSTSSSRPKAPPPIQTQQSRGSSRERNTSRGSGSRRAPSEDDDDEEIGIQVESEDVSESPQNIQPDPEVDFRSVEALKRPPRPQSTSGLPDSVDEDGQSLFIGLHSKRHAATAPAHLFKTKSVENLALRIDTDVASILEVQNQRNRSAFDYDKYRQKQAVDPIKIPIMSPVVVVPAEKQPSLVAQVRAKIHRGASHLALTKR